VFHFTHYRDLLLTTVRHKPDPATSEGGRTWMDIAGRYFDLIVEEA